MNTTERSWQVLAPNGSVVSVTDPSAASAPAGRRGFFSVAGPDAERLERIGEERASGAISSTVARVFGFDELLDAMTINERGGTQGRLIVDFGRS